MASVCRKAIEKKSNILTYGYPRRLTKRAPRIGGFRAMETNPRQQAACNCDWRGTRPRQAETRPMAIVEEPGSRREWSLYTSTRTFWTGRRTSAM
jgi:hypothetical protein